MESLIEYVRATFNPITTIVIAIGVVHRLYLLFKIVTGTDYADE